MGGHGFWWLFGVETCRNFQGFPWQRWLKRKNPRCDFPIRSIKSWITHVISSAQGSSALLHKVLRPHYRWGQGGFALSNQRIPEDAFDDSCWFKYHRERESLFIAIFCIYFVQTVQNSRMNTSDTSVDAGLSEHMTICEAKL